MRNLDTAGMTNKLDVSRSSGVNDGAFTLSRPLCSLSPGVSHSVLA